MSSSDQITIALSKKQIVILVLGAILFVLASYWLWQMDEQTIRSQHRFNNPDWVHTIGLVGIVFFGACAVFGGLKLFDAKPGLIFLDDGFVDNSSGIRAGFVAWHDVTDIRAFEINHQKMLAVELRDPESYIRKCKPWKQGIVRINAKMCGSPIVVSAIALNISFIELVAHFESYRSQFSCDR